MAKEPPADGIAVNLAIGPVSLQASRVKKDRISKLIHSAISKYKFFYSGEVKIGIEWAISEQQRYHKADSPDIDNIIKVLLDALSGPKGILLNDVQVQGVECHWVTPGGMSTISIRVSPLDYDDWIPKRDLKFLRVSKHLCLPINGRILKYKDTVGQILKMYKSFEGILAATKDYNKAKSVLPIQRLFHSAKLADFKSHILNGG